MTIAGAFVLFSITWFIVFFVVLQIGARSQGDEGQVVPGTPRSAPAVHVVGRKAWVTTLVATVVWLAMCAVILSEIVTIADLQALGSVRLDREP